MVHALKKAYRIFAPRGIMIDVRPLSVDVPLEIICQGGMESAGMIDMSPDIGLDIAADKAIESVHRERLYKELFTECFDFVYYWQTIKDMEEDFKEFWKDDVNVPDEVLQQASILFKKQRPQPQIRVVVQMKLSKYEKHW
jgi:hypothetical protein